MNDEIDKYIAESKEKKEKANAWGYAQYIHGFVIPTLEKQRE